MKTQSYLLEAFQDKEYGPSYALDKTAFHKVYGTTLFDFYPANVCAYRVVLMYLPADFYLQPEYDQVSRPFMDPCQTMN